MSSRRHSVEKSRLRMDTYSSITRPGRPKSPPRRRELDNVMKKARKEGPDKSNYWNKKLLEVEEKDPNRWRHSGFKELYGGGSRHSRSRSLTRSRSRTHSLSRDRSRTRSRTPRQKPPTPPRPKSPPPMRPPTPVRKSKSSRSVVRPKSPRPKPKSPPPLRVQSSSSKPRRPTTPPTKLRSESISSESVSSCSDESCSVCSPKYKPRIRDRREKEKVRPRPVSPRPPVRSRSRSFSVPRSRPAFVEKPRRKNKSRKREKEKSSVVKASRRRAIKVESESDRSSTPSPGPRLTLSERFGKMAQWSVDRDLEHRNLRITAGDRMTVEMDSPPSPPYAGSLSSFPEGSWDDVRVRYNYYKDQGYLRDLTLQDYIKWEEWWYKYQDWLDNEHYYNRSCIPARESVRTHHKYRQRGAALVLSRYMYMYRRRL